MFHQHRCAILSPPELVHSSTIAEEAINKESLAMVRIVQMQYTPDINHSQPERPERMKAVRLSPGPPNTLLREHPCLPRTAEYKASAQVSRHVSL